MLIPHLLFTLLPYGWLGTAAFLSQNLLSCPCSDPICWLHPMLPLTARVGSLNRGPMDWLSDIQLWAKCSGEKPVCSLGSISHSSCLSYSLNLQNPV